MKKFKKVFAVLLLMLLIAAPVNCRYESQQRTAICNTGWRNQSFKLLRTGNGNETPILQSVEF